MHTYAKPHLTWERQVQQLRDRGMGIPDPAQAARWLGVVGYYRLSGYWYPYRVLDEQSGQRQDAFQVGTDFDQIIALYQFDRRLKLLAVDALERIEIAQEHAGG